MPCYNNYLTHYGIKGMKWGVRRYRNEDGSLTSLGKRRAEYRSTNSEWKRSGKSSAALKAKRDYSKREFDDEKIRQRLRNQKKKSKRQTDLEQRYMDQGFTRDEAEIQAYKRVKTERALAVAGGMTIAALGAYAAYKHYDNVTDRILSKGSNLGRISMNDNKSVKDAFYAFTNKSDEHRYTGLYGKALSDQGNTVFKKSIIVGDNIKVASRDSAKKVLADLYKNDAKYRDDVKSSIGVYRMQWGKQGDLARKAYRDLEKGKITNSVYDAVNMSLANHTNDKANRASARYYEALKNAGYSAIKDMNDSKYSGYHSKNPMIIFDNSKVNITEVKKIGEGIIDQTAKKEITKLASRAIGEQLIPYLAISVGGALGTSAASNAIDNTYVRNYRKEHPNTALTRNQILKTRDSQER